MFRCPHRGPCDGTAAQKRDKLPRTGSWVAYRLLSHRVSHSRGSDIATRLGTLCDDGTTRTLSGSAASEGLRMRTDSSVPRPGGPVPPDVSSRDCPDRAIGHPRERPAMGNAGDTRRDIGHRTSDIEADARAVLGAGVSLPTGRRGDIDVRVSTHSNNRESLQQRGASGRPSRDPRVPSRCGNASPDSSEIARGRRGPC